MRYFTILTLSLTLAGLASAQKPVVPALPTGTRLFVAPMEWNPRPVYYRRRSSGGRLPVQLVGRPEDADFVMTSVYQSLGSHFMSPGHYIQVKIAGASDGRQVWFTEANDYALFFGAASSPRTHTRGWGTSFARLHHHMSPAVSQ